MIRLGLRLAVAGGREAVGRLAIIAGAVAVGVGLLLAVLAGSNGVDAQNARYAWLNTGAPGTLPAATNLPDAATNLPDAATDLPDAAANLRDAAATPGEGGPAGDRLWWLLRTDYFQGKTIIRVDVAATGPRAPVPPGLPRLPGPGEFSASPALSALLRTTPAAELADRFPAREVASLRSEALPAPDALIVVAGHHPDELSGLPGAREVTSINTLDPARCNGCPVGIGADALKLILSVVAVALIFPVLIFIGTATRLAAARRELRFAAMRLVGATPRQVRALATVEAAVAAGIGTVAGFGLFLPLRPALAAIPFTGAPFFPGDLSINATQALLVAVGVPAAAVAMAWLALRRVRLAPLGVARRVTPRPPRAWRVLPLVAGLGELAWFVDRRPATTNGQLLAYLSGTLLIMVGLVVAGPWLTLLGSRLLARRARRPATLIAARRLADDPKAGFRAVGGLALALFVASVATGVITTLVAERGGVGRRGSVFSASLTKTFWSEERAEGRPAPTAEAVPAGLAALPGVTDVLVVRSNPAEATPENWGPGLIACAELARVPAYGRCPEGAEVAAVFADLVGLRTMTEGPPVWPAAPLDAEQLRGLPMLSVVVWTDGSAAAVERARTVLATSFPQGRFPATVGEFEADFARSLIQFQHLANVVILASLPIAGCSLAVGVVGGLHDRRRPFSMLRLTGAPLAVLRRVVALESAVPLLIVAALAVGLGLLTAQLFLTSQLDYALRAPGPAYYLVVAVGLAGALGIVGSTLPLLRRLTGPQMARND